MSTLAEQHHGAVDKGSILMQISVAELAAVIWQRRRWLAMVTGAGLFLSVAVAFLIPNEYTSTAQLMPPDPMSVSTSSMLNAGSMLSALTGSGAMLAGGGGGLLSARTPGNTAIGILGSRTVQDDIIKRLGLLNVYHAKLYVDARKRLTSQTTFDEDKKSGIVSIAVVDHDPHRAHDIAEAYVEDLNTLLNIENNSSAHLERVFIEDRLKSLKSDMDATATKLSEFSSRNGTLNPQSQGTELIDAAGRLQGELITAQSTLEGLRAQFSDDNVRVRSAKARVNELQSQLRKMGGTEEEENGSTHLKAGELYPTLRELPMLGAAYSDIYRQLVVQQGLYETLTKQYEFAKVQEAKELPSIKVLDEPDVPEKKSSPHRLTIAILGALASAVGGIAWVISRRFWGYNIGSHLAEAA